MGNVRSSTHLEQCTPLDVMMLKLLLSVVFLVGILGCSASDPVSDDFTYECEHGLYKTNQYVISVKPFTDLCPSTTHSWNGRSKKCVKEGTNGQLHELNVYEKCMWLCSVRSNCVGINLKTASCELLRPLNDEVALEAKSATCDIDTGHWYQYCRRCRKAYTPNSQFRVVFKLTAHKEGNGLGWNCQGSDWYQAPVHVMGDGGVPRWQNKAVNYLETEQASVREVWVGESADACRILKDYGSSWEIEKYGSDTSHCSAAAKYGLCMHMPISCEGSCFWPIT